MAICPQCGIQRTNASGSCPICGYHPDAKNPKESNITTCPFCRETIQANALKCKHCGEFLDGRSKSAAIKPIKQDARVEDELWEGAPSYLYYLGHIVIGLLISFSALTWIFTNGLRGLPPVYLLGPSIILYAFLSRNSKCYTLTNKRAISKTGIISRQVREVWIKDIRNINVKQGIIERLFGLGTVEIASAGTAGIEVKFAGIRDPMQARDLIRQEKDKADTND